MVNSTALNIKNDYINFNDSSLDLECPKPSHSNVTSNISMSDLEGEFLWDEVQQGYILSSYFYGCILTHIPGGILASYFGGKWIYGGSLFVNAVLTLLTPLAARWDISALIVVRLLEGMAAGVHFPALYTLMGKWVPPLESSKLNSISFVGLQIGAIFSLCVTGYLCESTLFGGWPSVFYLFGTATIAWFLFWSIFVFESPEHHPRILEEEKKCLSKSILVSTHKTSPFPIKDVLSSIPFWTIAIGTLCWDWAQYSILLNVPLYLANVLHFDISENGLLSALPPLCHVIFSLLFSHCIDYFRSHRGLSTTTARKLANTVGFGGVGSALLVVYFAGCNRTLVVSLFCLGFGFEGAVTSGSLVNALDLAPQYAGVIFSMANTLACTAGAAPYVSGVLIKSYGATGWLIFFCTAAGFAAFTIVFSLIFISGELQYWAKDTESNDTNVVFDSKTQKVFYTTHL